MAIRADTFRCGVRFDPSIGPSGPNYAMGGETELALRLGRQGHKAWHVQTAVVEHFVRRYQMDMTWVSERAVRFGRGVYRLQNRAEPEASTPRALPLLLKMLRRHWRMMKAQLASDERALCLARWDLNYLRGQVLEARAGHLGQVGSRTGRSRRAPRETHI
jgi:hypothetical protein